MENLITILGSFSRRVGINVEDLTPQEMTAEELMDFEAERLEALTQEAELLEQEREIATELADVVSKIKALEQELRDKNAETVARVDALQEEVTALVEAKLTLDREREAEEYLNGLDRENEDIDLDELMREFFEKRGQGTSEDHVPVPQTAKVKKLFKRIAARTHPDKTSDLHLHELFLRAKACSVVNDYDGLQMIWESINTNRARSILNALMSRLETLRASVNNSQQQLHVLRESGPYKMLMDYQRPESAAAVEEYYRDILAHNEEQLKAAIRKLDPKRYPPVSPTRVRFTFSSTFNNKFD